MSNIELKLPQTLVLVHGVRVFFPETSFADLSNIDKYFPQITVIVYRHVGPSVSKIVTRQLQQIVIDHLYAELTSRYQDALFQVGHTSMMKALETAVTSGTIEGANEMLECLLPRELESAILRVIEDAVASLAWGGYNDDGDQTMIALM